MPKLDFATLAGIFVVWGLVVGTIFFGAASNSFLNLPSFTIVVGGTLAVTMMRFSVRQFIGSVTTAGKAFFHRHEPESELIAKIVELADIGRRNGMLALENIDIKNETLKKGVLMLVDGMDPDTIRKSLLTEINQTVGRHKVGQKLFKSMGDAAPAMGMVGTLIGLVQMLTNMNDPKSIGPAMAVALLTTLYGTMLAHMFALPLSDKLALRSKEEMNKKFIIVEGTLAIYDGLNPRAIEDVLSNYLPKSKGKSSVSSGGSDE